MGKFDGKDQQYSDLLFGIMRFKVRNLASVCFFLIVDFFIVLDV